MVNLSVLSFLYYIQGVYYLHAAIIAFIVSFLFSLFLQKFWTFEDHSREHMGMQVGKYLLSSIFGLSLNTLLLYIMVDHLHFFVYIGQIIAGGLVACVTFFISRKFIFKGQVDMFTFD